MTISSTTSRVNYTGNGATTVFAYSFRITEATDLTVTKTTDTGQATTLTYPADYSVSGVGNATGGSVTLTTALPSDYTLTLRRVLPLTQTRSFRTQGTFRADTHEDALDRLTMQVQQIEEVNDRTMTLPVASDPDVVSAVFPPPMASRVIIWNANATALETSILDTSSIAVPGGGRTVPTASAFLANNAEFNIRDYGAVGNDTLDCTTFIQNCLDAAGAAGGVVKVPAGTYKVTGVMDVPSGVTIRGEGPLSVIHATGMGGSIVLHGSTITNSGVENLQITGVHCGGVWFSSSTQVHVVDCLISGATSYKSGEGYGAGIRVRECEDVVIDGNILTGNGLVTELYQVHDILVNGSTSDGYKRIHIRNNHCYSVLVNTNICCFNVQDSEISGNECSGALTRPIAQNGGYGILVYSLGYFIPWDVTDPYAVGDVVYFGLELFRCVQANTGQALTNPAYWTELPHNAADNRITNNNVHDTEGSGIYCAGANRTIVANNTVTSAATYQSEVSLPASGICINGGSATVTGNVILSSGRSGIAFALNAGPCTCTSNQIQDSAGLAGIRLVGDVSDIRIADNTVRNSGLGIGSTDATWDNVNVSVIGNRIYDSSGNGIFLSLPVNCAVSKNTVTLSGAHGIWMYANGSNNSVSGNVVTDSGQLTPLTYSNINNQSPQTTITGNVTGNTLADGARYGVYNDPTAALGSSVTGNIGKDNRTLDFNLAAGTAAGGNTDSANLGAFTLGTLAQLTGQGSDGVQLLLGASSTSGALGTTGSQGDSFLATNARHGNAGASSLTWHQNNSAVASRLLLMRQQIGQPMFELYVAVAGTADGVFATFWGSAIYSIDINGQVAIGGNTVLKARETGWTAMTGTATKGGFATGSVTLPQLAQVVKALSDKMLADGMIGA